MHFFKLYVLLQTERTPEHRMLFFTSYQHASCDPSSNFCGVTCDRHDFGGYPLHFKLQIILSNFVTSDGYLLTFKELLSCPHENVLSLIFLFWSFQLKRATCLGVGMRGPRFSVIPTSRFTVGGKKLFLAFGRLWLSNTRKLAVPVYLFKSTKNQFPQILKLPVHQTLRNQRHQLLRN